MKNLFALLTMVPTFVHSARFSIFFDQNCSVPIMNVLAYTDVCTWASNQYSGSYAVNLADCTETGFDTFVYNASTASTCGGVPGDILQVTMNCTKHNDFYIMGYDTTCESQNQTYNILAHFTESCQDGGVPFSLDLGQTCSGAAFLPNFFNLDAEGLYIAPDYILNVYNSTDGTCTDELTTFQTTGFPAHCLSSTKNYKDIFIDIYQAFPV
jgi:hypothetical protein